jgi:hypothetical protein
VTAIPTRPVPVRFHAAVKTPQSDGRLLQLWGKPKNRSIHSTPMHTYVPGYLRTKMHQMDLHAVDDDVIAPS